MPKKKETEETKELKEQEVQSEPETAPESGIQSESEQIPEPETQPEPKQASEPETQPEQEKVQFRVQIKDKKVALRTSPEFRIDNSNLFGTADQEGTRLFDILEVKNGYGRGAYPAGTWISLDACIKY